MATFESVASSIRSYMRSIETTSLFIALIEHLQKLSEAMKAGKVSTPWIVLLAIDWTLELHQFNGKRKATPRDIERILNGIWRTQHLATDGGDSAIINQVRALIAPQIMYQKTPRQIAYFFLRFKLIVEADEKSSNQFKSEFLNKYAVNFDEFYEIIFIMIVCNMKEGKSSFLISNSFLTEHLVPYYGIEKISNSLKIISSDLNGLIFKSKQSPSRVVFNSEYYKDSIFLGTPLILVEKGLFIVETTVVMLGLSESIMRSFVRDDQKVRTIFTRSFEEYVYGLHASLKCSILREQSLRDFYHRNKVDNSKKVVDFLITSQNATLLIDAKGVEPNSKTLTATTKFSLTKKIEGSLIKAVRQISETIQVLSEHSHPELLDIDRRFGVIVTHMDFLIGTGETIFEYLHDDMIAEIKSVTAGKILIKNLHLITVESYEILCKVTEENDLALEDFFLYVQARQSNRATTNMAMDMYVQDFSKHVYGGPKMPNGSSELVAHTDFMFKKSVEVFTHSSNYWQQQGRLNPLEAPFKFANTCQTLIESLHRKK